MSSARDQFNRLDSRAKQFRSKGMLQESRQVYIKLFKTIDIRNVDFTDYISVKSELGDIQRELKLLNQSKSRYIQALNLLNKSPNHVSKYEIEKEKYHLLSNLGLTQSCQIEQIEDKKQHYHKMKALFTSILKNYQICQKIVVRMILENKTEDLDQEAKGSKFCWKTQFIQLIVNICNVISLEAFQFQDRYLMDLMVELIEKAESFYNMQVKKIKLHLLNYLSKCFYFKAICLKFLNKKKESEEYFKKDYQHCKQNKLTDDLKKTMLEMYKFYLQTLNFNEAKRIYKNYPIYITEINITQAQFKQIMRKAQSMKSKVRKSEKIDQDQLQEILFYFHDKKYPQKGLQFNKFMRQARQFKQNIQFRYWLQYYAAQYCLKLQKYQQAQKYLKEAMKIKENQTTQMAWCSLLNALILENTQTNRSKARIEFQRCLKLSENQQQQDCRAECKKQYERFLFSEDRRKTRSTFDTSQFDRLLQVMKERKQKKQQEKQQKNQNQFNQSMIDQQIEPMVYRVQKRLVKQLSQAQQYVQNCKLVNQQPIQMFKEILQNPSDIDLGKLFYFDTQQLLVLLNSAPSIQKLDITNFIITAQYLKRIRRIPNCFSFKSLKINAINASVLKQNEKNQYFQQLSGFLRQNNALEYIMISNAYESQQLRKIIHSKDIVCLQSLTVLKLKQCNLEDRDLIFYSLGQNLPQLKKLSLSGNKLKGRTLQALTYLKQIQTLSLSSNPLNDLSLNRPFEKLKKISLNYLSNSIPSSCYQSFICLLNSCQNIKMKYCQSVCQEILLKLIENAMSLETSLYSLRNLNLFGSQVNGSQVVSTFEKYYRRAPNLFSVDMRNCRILLSENDNSVQKKLQQFKNYFNHQKNIAYGNNMPDSQTSNGFKMGNSKFIRQNQKRAFKNFQIN